MNKIFKSNGIKYYVVISLVAVLAIGAAVTAYTVSNNVNVQGDYNYFEAEGQPSLPEDITVGAFPGPDFYTDVNVNGNFTHGGGAYYATTTTGAATYTLTAKEMQNYSYIDVLNSTAASSLTWTLPGTSTILGWFPQIGSTRSWYFHNATTSAGEARMFTLAAGTGVDLLTASSTSAFDGGSLKLECTRLYYRSKENKDVSCFVTPQTDLTGNGI